MSDISRIDLCLNGLWRFCPEYEVFDPQATQPAGAWAEQQIKVPGVWTEMHSAPDWKPFRNFDQPEDWYAAVAGWYERTLDLSNVPSNSRLILRFEAVNQCAHVCVNSVSVCCRESSGSTPFLCDITDLVNRDGLDTLRVHVYPVPSVDIDQKRVMKFLAPTGSWFGRYAMGIWQDVTLQVRQNVYVEKTKIVTSVRSGRLSVDTWVTNKARSHASVHIRHEVIDSAGNVVLTLSGETAIDAGHTCRSHASQSFPNARYWDVDDPYLYTLKTTIVSDVAEPDVQETKFGFREFWAEGHKFILNGKRINLRGDSWHFNGAVYQSEEYVRAWYLMMKSAGLNMVRPHAIVYPSYYLDIADEMGMLVIDESAIYGSGISCAVHDPRFWSACHDHLRDMIERDWNHPSVVMWSLSNEMKYNLSHMEAWEYGKDQMAGLAHLARELDHTRIIHFEGDECFPWADLASNVSDTQSAHYFGNWTDNRFANWEKEKPLIVGEFGRFYYGTPENTAELGGDKVFADYDHMHWAMGEDVRYHFEDARVREVPALSAFNFIWYMHHTVPEKTVRLEWDRLDTPGVKPDFVSPYSTTVHPSCNAETPKMIPYPSFERIAKSMSPLAVFVREKDCSFFSGSLRRTLAVFNDTREHRRLTVRWEAGADDVLWESGEIGFFLPPGEHAVTPVEFVIPETNDRTPFTFTVSLMDDQRKIVFKDAKRYVAHAQRTVTSRQPSAAAIIGSTANMREILPNSEMFSSVPYELVGRYSSLVVAPYAFKEIAVSDGDVERLLEFAESGGRILILEQESFPRAMERILGVSTASVCSDIVHQGMPEHSVLRDIGDEELRFWGTNSYGHGANRVVVNAMRKPAIGNFKNILHVAQERSDGGMKWSALTELEYGNGLIMLSQLALKDNIAAYPGAAIILQNLLEWLHASIPARRSQIRTNPDLGSPIWDLSRSGFRISNCGLGAYPQVCDSKSGIQEALRSGDTVVLFDLDPAAATELGSQLGCTLNVEDAPTRQVMLSEHVGVFSGLSNQDFYWVPLGLNIAERCISCSSPDARALITSSATGCDYISRQDIAEQTITGMRERYIAGYRPRHYCLEIPVGRGRLIICQLQLRKAMESCAQYNVLRILSALLTNLHVPVHPAGVSYAEQDLEHADSGSVFRFLRRSVDLVDADLRRDHLSDEMGEGGVLPDLRLMEDQSRWTFQPQVHDLKPRVWYAFAYIYSPRMREDIFVSPQAMPSVHIDGVEEAKLIANGELQYTTVPDGEVPKRCVNNVFGFSNHTESSKSASRHHQVDLVPLKTGWNRILLKTISKGVPSLSITFADRNGRPLNDLMFSLYNPFVCEVSNAPKADPAAGREEEKKMCLTCQGIGVII